MKDLASDCGQRSAEMRACHAEPIPRNIENRGLQAFDRVALRSNSKAVYELCKVVVGQGRDLLPSLTQLGNARVG
jgi:hypothetical protein